MRTNETVSDSRKTPRSAGNQIIFLFGALRSGTTLLRVMLQQHPRIAGCGEADFLLDHIRPDPGHPTGWRYDIDALRRDRIFADKKLALPPGRDGLDLLSDLLGQMEARGTGGPVVISLHRHAPRLLDCVPGARLVHLLRDPRDVARSSIGMGWVGTAYYGVDHWMRTEASWQKAKDSLAHGQALALRYEVLLTDTETELRRLCSFLGLDYDPSMLEYHRHSTYGPPDPNLTEQWRRKSTPSEVALIEGKAGALMRASAYEPSGAGHRPGRVERALLYVRDRRGVLAFRARRYGLGDTLLELVTRKLGLPGHSKVRARWNDAVRKHLK